MQCPLFVNILFESIIKCGVKHPNMTIKVKCKMFIIVFVAVESPVTILHILIMCLATWPRGNPFSRMVRVHVL